MEEHVSINIVLIVLIIGLPSMGKSPIQYLDEKSEEKDLAEEMNKTYGIERGLHRIIIKRINDAATRMTKKIMV